MKSTDATQFIQEVAEGLLQGVQGTFNEETLNKDVSFVAGRLKHFHHNWVRIISNPKILSWIKGYKIPFKSIPYRNKSIRQMKFSKLETEIVSDLITKLINKAVIKECQPVEGQFLSNIFIIPKPDGSHRLILNLKDLNEFVYTEHFKLEDYKIAMRLIERDCFMTTIDLKEAYYLVAIDDSDKKFLRFEFFWKLFEFSCLPFGLSTAPFVFTKLMKPVIQILRTAGFSSVLYLDDFSLFGNSPGECSSNFKITYKLLVALGFIPNDEKSQSDPSKRCKFLGFIFYSVSMTLQLPEEKKNSILLLLKKFEKMKR